MEELNGLKEQNRQLKEENNLQNLQNLHNMQARHSGVRFHFHFLASLNVLFNNLAISLTGPKTHVLTILRAATQRQEWGDHDFCLSRSHYTDT